MQVDVVAFGPHPDDVELTMGGTLLRLRSLGYRTAIADLTAGEMGTRGSREERAEEASRAAEILGVSTRVNLDLGDGRLGVSTESRRAVVECLRELRPRLVFTNYPENNHPDHTASGPLVAEASYLAGLANYEADGSPHRPNCVLYYLAPHKVAPSFIVDITAVSRAEDAGRSARMQSQLHDPADGRMPTEDLYQPARVSRPRSSPSTATTGR